ncbi:MAG: GxxExxY protein [Anaerolineales bacterium]|nr:MAG: GxxExxY protein [Anaerolineales bacterium]
MTIIRPRLSDFYNIPLVQEEIDFVIPFLDEDIPLYLDPFLLWKSPSLQDNALHTALVNSFNHLGYLVNKGKESDAIATLIRASECQEAGLGFSKNRHGVKLSKKLASSITALFRNIPQIKAGGFTHFEEVQLLVDNFSKDRVSDIACNFVGSFLIDFTIQESEKYKIPIKKIDNFETYDYRKNKFVTESVSLPQNPETKAPLFLIPKRWLRKIPWIGFDDYVEKYYTTEIGKSVREIDRVRILSFNRKNYDLVRVYTAKRERQQYDCKNDPLFNPIPILSAKRKLQTILLLPTGKTNNADRKYEDGISQLMASLLYPYLDFAKEQSRTDSGTQIRDLIFYNNRSLDFLKDIYKDYGSQQIIMEIKNVEKIQREHINQLNRYLSESLGRFGVIITRNKLPKNIRQNTIDLWSGQRKCIIAITDEDLKLMVSVFESKQRLPIEVLKRAFIDFIRSTPS